MVLICNFSLAQQLVNNDWGHDSVATQNISLHTRLPFGNRPPVCFLHTFVSLLVIIHIQDGIADSSEKDLCYL
jgi:hypothetical protein